MGTGILAPAESTGPHRRFESLRVAWWPAIRELIDEVASEAIPSGSPLAEMLHYHLATGGKRLRAILPLLVGEALGGDLRRLLPFSAACEMLHNASLVHDDLQDEDRMRRGRPTVWHRFGKPQAINLGDAMIAYTVLLMQRLRVPTALRESATRRVMLEMLRVIDGQSRELALQTRREVSLEDYLRMVEGKTSRLLALPMGGAAVLCGAPEAVEQGLIAAACEIGVLFQIQDDIVDLFGDKGRGQWGNDVREGKRSVLAVHCLQAAEPTEASWLLEVLDRPRDVTSQRDVERARALFLRTGSLDFAVAELGRRIWAVREIPALAAYPAVQEVLESACHLLLAGVRPLLPFGFPERVGRWAPADGEVAA